MLCEYKGQGCSQEDVCERQVDGKGFRCGLRPYMDFLCDFTVDKELRLMTDKEADRVYHAAIKERNKRLMASVVKRMSK